jgi:hypothetical protein
MKEGQYKKNEEQIERNASLFNTMYIDTNLP